MRKKKIPAALVYDLEIKKAILGKGESPLPGIEYAKNGNDPMF